VPPDVCLTSIERSVGRIDIFLTVTIQTYNHADALAATLHSLAALRCPDDADYEILVINNNSSDHTAAVVREFGPVLGPRLWSLPEPRQGLSHARNLALAEARGDVVCFLDDDALADSGWLAAHAEVYRADDRTVAVAGRIRLQWPPGWSRPAWLSGTLEGYLSGLDLGPDRLVLEYPQHPYGCNMSVRREAARAIGGFCDRLGRKGRRLLSNEEKHFFYRLYEHGGQVVYAPDSVVHHVIPPERLSKRFFLQRAYAQGVSDLLVRREMRPRAAGPEPGVRPFLGGLRLAAGMCAKASAEIVSRRDRAACFLGLARGAYAAGYIVAAAGLTG
jgi:glycosyltransferase involved in cell wall biosynthesis